MCLRRRALFFVTGGWQLASGLCCCARLNCAAVPKCQQQREAKDSSLEFGLKENLVSS